MRFELFVALRYLFAKRKQSFISAISIFSIAGVALGVASLIIVMGVMNGFTLDLRDKILGVNAQVMAFSSSGNMTNYHELLPMVESVPGVTGVTPFLYSEVMLSSNIGVKGLVLRGIDPQSAPKVLGVLKRIDKGNLNGLLPEQEKENGLPGLVIGKELAARLGAGIGTRVNMLSPAGQRGATGFSPRIKSFTVVAIFSTGMFEYDSSLGFVSLPAARDILGLAGDQVTGLEIAVTDLDRADKVAEAVAAKIGPGYYTRNWMEMNANLFAALKLEKFALGIILALIVVVGSFSIIATLVMLVMEKTRDIAIMMSMGATTRAIRRIFILQGTIIGFVGTSIGFVLGLTVAGLLERYKFIKLPSGVYSSDYLMVILRWQDQLAIGLAAMLLCFLATLYPARQASSLEPVEALRYE